MVRFLAGRERLACTAEGNLAPVTTDRSAAVERLVELVGAFSPSEGSAPASRAAVLAAVGEVAAALEVAGCDGADDGYARCLLHDDAAGWSVAAVVLRPGQVTPPHDHGGWGGAVTLQGVERDRRFAADATGALTLVEERDYPPGTGYLFAPDDVHQPIGADPDGVTIALHFLFHPPHPGEQRHHEAVGRR